MKMNAAYGDLMETIAKCPAVWHAEPSCTAFSEFYYNY